MQLPADFRRFLAPGADRLVALAGILAGRGLEYSVLPAAGARHLLVRLGAGRPRLVLVAHYDRAPGSPGFLDNSAACLALADFGARLGGGLGGGLRGRPAGAGALEEGGTGGGAPNSLAGGPYGGGKAALPGLCLLFTDAEEKPAESGALTQGAYALARGLKAAFAAAFSADLQAAGARRGARADAGNPTDELPRFLVLDVVGRGDRLLLSTASAALLERSGKGAESLAGRIEALACLALSAAERAGLPAPLRVPLPWSDDLGLVLGGLPALTLSLLPAAEARAYATLNAGEPAPRSAAPSRAEAGQAWPATWDYLHTAADGPALAASEPFALVAAFLDALALLA
ncbi:MAG: M28 family peptidase [Spirochaetaceae bacterium]|nr:M28 family peptidase [Spirochaetaceae bacterium]